jgi:hypothetical protein
VPIHLWPVHDRKKGPNHIGPRPAPPQVAQLNATSAPYHDGWPGSSSDIILSMLTYPSTPACMQNLRLPVYKSADVFWQRQAVCDVLGYMISYFQGSAASVSGSSAAPPGTSVAAAPLALPPPSAAAAVEQGGSQPEGHGLLPKSELRPLELFKWVGTSGHAPLPRQGCMAEVVAVVCTSQHCSRHVPCNACITYEQPITR